jgi:hypothetical protein
MSERPEDFIAIVEQRIAEQNYEDLFNAACCYHFALCAFKRGLGKLAFVSTRERERMGHVFVVSAGKDDCRAFDRKGFRTVEALVKDSGGDWWAITDDKKVAAAAEKRPLPLELSRRVYDTADWLITELLKQAAA